MRRVLESIAPVCDHVFVFDDHSEDETVKDCYRELNEGVTVLCSPFRLGVIDESRDKNYLLDHVLEAEPDFVLAIDGDEVLEHGAYKTIADATSGNPAELPVAWSFKVCYFWDSETQYRVDGVYGNFRRPSLFRVGFQKTRMLRYRNTTCGGNLHCSNLPEGLTGATVDIDCRLKHFGYVDRPLRMRKFDFYNALDPNNESEDCYRHIAEIPGARYAPGPMQLETWIDR